MTPPEPAQPRDAGTELPLFPLGTVLFPGGLMPLQIFETRYLDLVKRCMREQRPFGVVLIREGSEASGDEDFPPKVADVGTRARIVDFTQLANGMLGITARGEDRFRLGATRVQDDRLLVGEATPLAEPDAVEVPAECFPARDPAAAARASGGQPARGGGGLEDARSVSGRLADLLPVSATLKQSLLELDDPILRLAELERVVHAMQEEAEGAD
ncbi:MAG: LON peptidase substrate-binding domain-containing protein [Gammaproteobacteria bacterium]|nr:LON peptidase substrate-binding domain-containing protein [Gammaproteobacteria bacterium]